MTNLEAIRKRKGMTQEALASEIGVSRAFISQLESGKFNPSIKTAMALSKALGCSLDELVGKEEENENDNAG